ncbi:MAG: restriction endonuclease subunit R, partial [Bacteroidetes bacterium]|nr:restriction endonuclease subunit R [Bacteroidota bacterium]
VDNTPNIFAKITLHVNTSSGPKEKIVRVRQGTDLYQISNEREAYKDGYVITEINTEPENEYIEFNNGKYLSLGQEQGGIRDDVMKVQIKNTIKKHLEKEKQLKEKGIKVLSLFFVDKVANYRSYNEQGEAVQGKFANWFEEYYNEFIEQPRYKDLIPYPVEKVHDGYFAQDKKGVLKDTKGNSLADENVYNKSMKNKKGQTTVGLLVFPILILILV